ncbi:MAG: hypothetical protein M3R09_09130, partial [Actinomycetota bacterium]|nr:hypothetical protein [Actinomycetota bacterium]
MDLKEQTVTIPLHVNVVPGDQPAGRVVNPMVVTELAFQKAQSAKRDASRRLSGGDGDGAVRGLRDARSAVLGAMAAAPLSAQPELADEAALIEDMLAESEHGSPSRAAKFLSSDAMGKSRTRGRVAEAAGVRVVSESRTGVSSCQEDGGGVCRSFAPGHQMHVIHAGRVGEIPWGVARRHRCHSRRPGRHRSIRPGEHDNPHLAPRVAYVPVGGERAGAGARGIP